MDSYSVVVSERVNMKHEADGSIQQYFTVYAKVQDGEMFPKVERTYRDFKSLEVALNNMLRGSDIECPRLEGDSSPRESNEFGNDDVPINEKITNIRRFCKKIAADVALHLDPFYEFFQIPKPEVFQDGRVSDVLISDKFKATMKPDFRLLKHHGAELWSEYDKEFLADYTGCFKVAMIGQPFEKEDPSEVSPSKSHFYFSMAIKSLIDSNVMTSIEKRYNEFFDLALKMKSAVIARPPPLPPKVLVKDKNTLQKRGDALEEWLMTVLNEKMYFCNDLFQFADLEISTIPKYIETDPVQRFKEHMNVKFEVTGQQAVQKSDECFAVWDVKIRIFDALTSDELDSYQVMRRFKEFDHLHSELSGKFKKYAKKLPDLPSKISLAILSSKENQEDERKSQLGVYLQKLSEYPDIYSTISFRKFINLNASRIDNLLERTSKQR